MRTSASTARPGMDVISGHRSPETHDFARWVFCAATLGLATFGLVMLTSTTAMQAYRGEAFYFAKRQALWLGVGLLAGVVMARMDYRRLRALAWPLFVSAAVLLVAVLLFGRRVNGAVRWFAFGPMRFQPSEFAKLALVVLLAAWLERMQRAPKGRPGPRLQHWWWGVFAPLVLAGGLAGLVYLGPDLGTALLLGAVAFTLLWLAGSPGAWLGTILAVGTGAVVALLFAIFQYGCFEDAYQVQRLLHWWRQDDPDGSNYQQRVAVLAFGSGGPHGMGFGNSRMKLGFLPEAHTDFILPIIGEELGVGASLAMLVAFGAVVASGLRLANQALDSFGRLLGFRVMTTFAMQALINMAVVTNTLPNKGMALPLISYGGSSLVMTLAAFGIVLSIARRSRGSAKVLA